MSRRALSPILCLTLSRNLTAFANVRHHHLDPGHNERVRLREDLWAKYEDIYLTLTIDKGMEKGEAIAAMESTLQSFSAGRLRA